LQELYLSLLISRKHARVQTDVVNETYFAEPCKVAVVSATLVAISGLIFITDMSFLFSDKILQHKGR